MSRIQFDDNSSSPFQKYYNEYKATHPEFEPDETIVPFIFNKDTFCSDLLFINEESVWIGNKYDEDFDDVEYMKQVWTHWKLVGGDEDEGIVVYKVTVSTPKKSYFGKHEVSAVLKINYEEYGEVESCSSLVVDGEPINSADEEEAYLQYVAYVIGDGWGPDGVYM